ncbi:class I SAM-dependent methyltransferase [Actinocrinis puniceicyclus]|uniref:Class I SAM-dependent methyltransferase n=1 Tax=Actinocrinis puniceicyclus TaxID=977794 RepID=A0A8J7WLN4_9ACTN|nr:class I SAM-dependent methyltransferase [Actinocrinis puniceicyclus]MBS2961997.1 class I SAM-dependent methyltransferase [Actinocrinis puniceicyclus]
MARLPAPGGRNRFEELHAGTPPWDIGRPQPAFAALAKQGEIRGRVLDVGCGTGEHTLMAAARGMTATGIDLDAGAVRAAERKACARGLAARFRQHDALRLAELGESFDTVLDSLCLHALSAADRGVYLDAVRRILDPGGRFFALCYSERQPAGSGVPHRRSRREIGSWFAEGWVLDRLEATMCAANPFPEGVAAWLVACTRT